MKPARNFAVALVALGIVMLVAAIVYHLQFLIGVVAIMSLIFKIGPFG